MAQDKERFKISDGFGIFFKDLKTWLSITKEDISETRFTALSLMNNNKKEYIIFKLDSESTDYTREKLKDLIFPFGKFFIDTPIYIKEDDDLIIINGFFLFKEEEMIFYSFIWSTIIADRINFCIGSIANLQKFSNKTQMKIEGTSFLKKETEEKMHEIIIKRVYQLLRLIEKKEYHTYKKYSGCNKYEKKEIVYASDVAAHKRHFWKDSGRFKIPYMNKDELITKGYGIDETVFKDNQLRTNVPYRLINDFTINENSNHQKENRVIELFKHKHYRNEEKLGKLIKEIYPNEYIKHNKSFCKNSNLSLDWNLPKLRIGFEYDGEQHYEKELYNKLYGDGFEEQIKRDKKKDKLCHKRNITLIRIKYDEPLTISHIKKKIKNMGL